MSISRHFYLLEYTVQTPGEDNDPAENHRRMLSLSAAEAAALPRYIDHLDPQGLLVYELTPVATDKQARVILAAAVSEAQDG